MNLRELLDSEMDLRAILPLIRRGFSWWVTELAGLAPASWRHALSGRASVTALPGPEGWRFWRDGRPVPEGRVLSGGDRRVRLLLPPEDVLIREISTPRMSLADVRRMVALDLDRLSPLKPELVHHDTEIAAAAADGGASQTIRVAIAPKSVAAQRLQEAALAGLEPTSLGVACDTESAFDLLPAVQSEAGLRRGGRASPYLWAVGALLVLNLVAFELRDLRDVALLRRAVATARPAAEAALRQRRVIIAEEARRRALLARGEASEPLRILSSLTGAVPHGAWVQHLEWNGRTLRITGFKPAAVDMSAAIRGTGMLAMPRSVTGAEAPPASGGAPFDITAEARSVGP